MFIELWYYYTQETIILRPMANLAWIAFSLYGLFRIIMKRLYNRTALYSWVIIFATFAVIFNGFYSVDMDSSMQVIMKYFTFFLAGSVMLLDKEEVYFFKYLSLFSVMFLGILFVEFFFPRIYMSFFEPLLPEAYAANRNRLLVVDGAYVGLANQTSVTEFILNIGVALCVFNLVATDGKKTKITRFIPVLLFVVGLLLTNRRGGVLVALFLLALFLFLNKRTMLTTSFLIIFLTLILVFAGADIIPGLSGIMEKFRMNSGDASHGRIEIWERIIASGRIKWLGGNGLGSLSSQLGGVLGTSSAHNAYLQLLYEMGVLGTIAYVAPSVYSVIKGIKLFFLYKDNMRATRLFAEISFCLYIQLMILIFSLFEATLTNPTVLFVLAPAQLKIAMTTKGPKEGF